jgi:hypothetical protein
MIGAAVLAAVFTCACATNGPTTVEAPVGDAPGDIATDTPPPPPTRDAAPPAPGPEYVWNEGFWKWAGNQHYEWFPGHWVLPPEGWVWIPNRWVWRGHQWHWRAGHWRRS